MSDVAVTPVITDHTEYKKERSFLDAETGSL